mgnify:CR=1 FL=1
MDVGYGQLDWQLRNDPRVEVLERTNARHLEPAMLSEAADFATFDLSFISLTKVMPAVVKCLQPRFEAVAPVKPQSEAGPGPGGKGGVGRGQAAPRAGVRAPGGCVPAAGGAPREGRRGPTGLPRAVSVSVTW